MQVRPFTWLAAGSAGGAGVVTVLWGLSYLGMNGWRVAVDRRTTWLVGTGDGQLDLRRTRRAPITSGQGHWQFAAPVGTHAVRLPGLVVERTTFMRWHLRPGAIAATQPASRPTRMVFDSVVWHVRVAYGLPWAALAVGPGVWVARARRRGVRADRRRGGRCAACGYDLRASPDRCPECGAAAGPPGAV